ncbi:PleD family two-component system response regulator [Pseudomonas sp. ABC1]|uniref:response regulator n=1 Tax=Pseudomonas sp. ABC1 TaxID=2748080 RepID=UPI0015C30EB4|nr:PleD family two-component system response regulator [Pseudomonas sp. ABC1]QLF93803.1 PleD family two-component system response regulator [Pseudomonas sp. ABC1]
MSQPTENPSHPCNLSDCSMMVLLVDDQAMIGEAVRRALSGACDIDFHFCSDPQQALSVAQQIKPTVILQDLIMPGVDGLDLLKQYRAAPGLHDVPIIVLSSKEDAQVKSMAFAHGANDYLVKLPDVIELLARIRYHSNSYLTLQQRDEAYRALRESQQQLLETNLVLQRLIKSDGLTGLANRRYFDEYLEIEWSRALRDQSELSLLMIDVDYFKAYNDQHGHVAGDEVLRRVGEALSVSCTRASDLVARYGGEEFAVVMPGTTAGGARLQAEKVRRTVEAMGIPHELPTPGSAISVSIGIATVRPVLNLQPMSLVSRADEGLYLAKRGGRNQVAVATDKVEVPLRS